MDLDVSLVLLGSSGEKLTSQERRLLRLGAGRLAASGLLSSRMRGDGCNIDVSVGSPIGAIGNRIGTIFCAVIEDGDSTRRVSYFVPGVIVRLGLFE